MQENVACLMKDFVLLAVSIYLLKQDLPRLLIGKIAEEQRIRFTRVLFSCRDLEKIRIERNKNQARTRRGEVKNRKYKVRNENLH